MTGGMVLMNNQFAEWYCHNCNKRYYFQIDVTADDSHTFYVCPGCKYEYIELECLKCNHGEFKYDLESRPLSWTCEECGAVLEFEPDFYQHPVKLYCFEELPQETQSDFEKGKIKGKIKMLLFFAFILVPPVIMLVMFLIEKCQK
jgi:transcription elongation factor Elf1